MHYYKRNNNVIFNNILPASVLTGVVDYESSASPDGASPRDELDVISNSCGKDAGKIDMIYEE